MKKNATKCGGESGKEVGDEVDYYNLYWNIGHEFVWGVDNLK